jgi:Fe-S cluster assembly protein SufD
VLSRTQIFARFAGEGAHGDFTGLNLVDDGQHCDFTLDVSHAVPNTTSQEVFKQVARGRSKAVFQGRIVVARDAQKTDAKMMMQGLMLSDEAEILSKPELEIYADDVVCGHGSTCGELDEDSMFYLMSRGIPKAEAETMLVRGFLEEVMDPITDAALHEALTNVVDSWLLAGGK